MGLWVPELVDYFNGSLKGILVDNQPVNAIYSQPDIASAPDMSVRLPEINFKVYNILSDKNRYRSDIILTRTDSNNVVYTKQSPEPYELFFQFVLSAKYMDDMVQMETQMTSLFPPRGTITVADPTLIASSDPNPNYTLDMFLVDYRPMDFDLVNTAREGQIPLRLLRRMYRYMVKCEQDIYPWVTTNAKPVQGVVPNASTSNKPVTPPSS